MELIPVRRGCEGAVQASGWWDRVYRRYPEESEWETTEEVAKGQGQGGPAKVFGRGEDQDPALILPSFICARSIVRFSFNK